MSGFGGFGNSNGASNQSPMFGNNNNNNNGTSAPIPPGNALFGNTNSFMSTPNAFNVTPSSSTGFGASGTNAPLTFGTAMAGGNATAVASANTSSTATFGTSPNTTPNQFGVSAQTNPSNTTNTTTTTTTTFGTSANLANRSTGFGNIDTQTNTNISTNAFSSAPFSAPNHHSHANPTNTSITDGGNTLTSTPSSNPFTSPFADTGTSNAAHHTPSQAKSATATTTTSATTATFSSPFGPPAGSASAVSGGGMTFATSSNVLPVNSTATFSNTPFGGAGNVMNPNAFRSIGAESAGPFASTDSTHLGGGIPTATQHYTPFGGGGGGTKFGTSKSTADANVPHEASTTAFGGTAHKDANASIFGVVTSEDRMGITPHAGGTMAKTRHRNVPSSNVNGPADNYVPFSSPFGGGADTIDVSPSATPSSTFPSSKTMTSDVSSTFGGKAPSATHSSFGDSNYNENDVNNTTTASSEKEKRDEELAKLKAKIEKRKQLLLEKKKRQAIVEANANRYSSSTATTGGITDHDNMVNANVSVSAFSNTNNAENANTTLSSSTLSSSSPIASSVMNPMAQPFTPSATRLDAAVKMDNQKNVHHQNHNKKNESFSPTRGITEHSINKNSAHFSPSPATSEYFGNDNLNHKKNTPVSLSPVISEHFNKPIKAHSPTPATDDNDTFIKPNKTFSPTSHINSNNNFKNDTTSTNDVLASDENESQSSINRSSTHLLPTELRNRVLKTSQQKPDEEGNESTDTSSTTKKFLTGTCLHMCPDEELLKRESESDIQLLELPHSQIHPSHYTLRETTIKRFRRSAADFKLDIPNLVRPPPVLEQVVAYLEEWIMERDRQGPDPRFVASPVVASSTPPSLDVYQFIWDRTRMVRKDFILQNYTGTGGRCSATAVRCHERIARWHAMCEHQLSHLQDFVLMQSQQNVQELGQTMKTLNLYYDDSAGRCILEDDLSDAGDRDRNGGFVFGCRSDFVMGKGPVDYDGKSLDNGDSSDGSNVQNRIIQSKRRSDSEGTAEPEMRGLYILLTLNNDGGMEVLKFAARLSLERPEVFNSIPVQLALSIYKAKKEYNYARFFSILKSPSTPYLFACIMFKYVEQMRKVAFKVMTKTFGTKRKDTGEGVYDSYPLRDLVSLLCFEDLNEAMEACRHYNITVEKVTISNNDGDGESHEVDMIFWRHSDFREPRDPKKGTVIHLTPRKMRRTIESKLSGVTRLAVCRGEVSGEGATLSKPLLLKRGSGVVVSPQLLRSTNSRLERMAEEEKSRRQKEEEDRIATLRAEEERKRFEEEERRIEEQKKRKILEERKKRREDIAKRQAEEELTRQREKIRQKEMERKEALKKAEEQKKREQAALKEEQRKREEEARILAWKAERRKALEEENERKRQLELARKRAEEELKRRLQLENEERQRKKREAEHLRLFELERQREEEERKRRAKEEEERRINLYWQGKINFAKKLVILRMWSAHLRQRRYSIDSTTNTLQYFNPMSPKLSKKIPRKHLTGEALVLCEDRDNCMARRGYRYVDEELFYRMGTNSTQQINLSKRLSSVLNEQGITRNTFSESNPNCYVILFKLAIIVLESNGTRGKCIAQLIRTWIGTRLGFGFVSSESTDDRIEVRTVAVDCSEDLQKIKGYDAVLFVIPPSNGEGNPIGLSSDILACIRSDAHHLILNLDAKDNNQYIRQVESLLTKCKKEEEGIHVFDAASKLSNPGELDESLCICCDILAEEFVLGMSVTDRVDTSIHIVNKVTIEKVCCSIMRTSICKSQIQLAPSNVLSSHCEESLLECCRNALGNLMNEVELIEKDIDKKSWSDWPAREFVTSSSNEVLNYFSKGGLPLNWREYLVKSNLERNISELYPSLQQNNTFTEFLGDILVHAPPRLRQKCGIMLKHKQVVQCLNLALQWQEHHESTLNLYFPLGQVTKILEQVGSKQHKIEFTSEIFDFPLPSENALNGNSTKTRESLQLNNNRKEQQPLMSPQSYYKRSKRAIPKESDETKSYMKRFRDNKKRKIVSNDVIESKNFTTNLEALLYGSAVFDMSIGNSNLADILGRSSTP